MDVLVVCRDSRVLAIVTAFAGHRCLRLTGDSSRPSWDVWDDRQHRWHPVLDALPKIIDVVVVHVGDRPLMEISMIPPIRVKLEFSGEGFRDAAETNRQSIESWAADGGCLELRVLAPVSLEPGTRFLDGEDVNALRALADKQGDDLPPCCSSGRAVSDQLAALDILIQGWLIRFSPDDLWDSIRSELPAVNAMADMGPVSAFLKSEERWISEIEGSSESIKAAVQKIASGEPPTAIEINVVESAHQELVAMLADRQGQQATWQRSAEPDARNQA